MVSTARHALAGKYRSPGDDVDEHAGDVDHLDHLLAGGVGVDTRRRGGATHGVIWGCNVQALESYGR